MSVKVRILISVVVSFLPCISTAGWRVVSNGGHVVVCTNSVGKNSIVALDYYEAINRYKLSPKLGFETDSWFEIAKSLLARLDNPIVAQSGADIIEQIMHYAATAKNLPFSGDTGYYEIDANCDLMQLFLQTRAPAEAWNTPHIFDAYLWEQMTAEQKAIMVVHEAIYRMSGKARRMHSSEGVRKLVALLVSSRCESVFKYPEEPGEILPCEDRALFQRMIEELEISVLIY